MCMDYNDIFEYYENTLCLGLLNGRCGLVLLGFLLAEKNEIYKVTTLTHLEYLLTHVYESSSLSFGEGLLGIGWTLEFLVQNHFISNFNEDLLQEIDDVIYKWVNFNGMKSFSMNDGYLGCLLYFCYRLKGNRISMPYRELALKECTIRILGRLYSEVKKQSAAQLSDMEWRQLHVLAGMFKNMNIQNHITSDLLKETKYKVKPTKYCCKSYSNLDLMKQIYLLFEKSCKNKVVKNFFMY